MDEIPLRPEMFEADELCFGCGPAHPIGLRLRFTRTEDEVLTRFVPGDRYQGPPGIMHGGLVMTAADELAAWTLIGLRERFGFTVGVQARLPGPLRVGAEVLGRGRLTKESSRIVRVEVAFSQEEKAGAGWKDAFRGEFTFALLDRAAAEKLLGMSLPQAWQRFCR